MKKWIGHKLLNSGTLLIVQLGMILIVALPFSCDSRMRVGDNSLPDQISYNFHIRPILSDNCFACHGPDANKREANLRLDLEKEAFQALKEHPEKHPLVPGKPGKSEVYQRIVSEDPGEKMPPPDSKLTLADEQIKMIEKWIRQGAQYEPHWAFVPPKKPKLPEIEQTQWPTNPIDYFILNKQEEKGLGPNMEADKEMLLRRASLDITGLPPTLAMMDKFLNEKGPEAYEVLIDGLLADKAYGEKMAIHWMDLARYADSHGYQDDNFRSQWPWRDWVIHAFNKNLPYDQFITWQIAGDLLPDATKEQVLATGFNRNHKITEEGGVIDEEYRVEYVVDRTNTVSKAILGITMECAQCHDHKFDPFSQKEYFQMYAFFNNVKEVGHESNVGGPETYAKHPKIQITNEEVNGILSFVNKPDTLDLMVSVMGDIADTARSTYVMERGAYDAPGEQVFPGTPSEVLPFGQQFPPNRLGLAQWFFDKDNPLTARVFVNRIWLEFFGKGLVGTEGDFGMQGDLPSHPDLLDWLAVDFMENNWDIKRLVKLIVSSSTYKQSSAITSEKLLSDPGNQYYTRSARQRLKAELVKDLVMASSGLLEKKIGGPSVKPYQPDGLWEAAASTGAKNGILGTYIQDHGEKLYRRGLYSFIKRTLPPPSMMIFDGSNRDLCETKREATNTPLQALVMMNDPMVLEASRVFAENLLETETSEKEKIHTAFRTIVGRKPDTEEMDILRLQHHEMLTQYKDAPDKAKRILEVGEFPIKENRNPVEVAALMQVITLIYNLDETITRS
ncbi:MAG: PSD1 and planctomycete cytochrome C domain-containing protein [Cyclobacteriaceae bacterium]